MSFLARFALAFSFPFLVSPAGAAPAPHALEDFLKPDQVDDLSLSPDGTYYAITQTLEDGAVLVIRRRSDMKVTGLMNFRGGTEVAKFWWVSDDRLLVSVAEKLGSLDRPVPTGEIFGTDADGGRQSMLVGYRVQGGGLGSNIKGKQAEWVHAELVDALPAEEKSVLISVVPLDQGAEPYTRAERMDIFSGRRSVVARAPVRRASFVTDGTGEVRFAIGAGADNQSRTYYRRGREAEWELINDEAQSHRIVLPIGFSADGSVAYLQVEEATGPDSIQAFDPDSKALSPLMRGEFADPDHYIFSRDGRTPIGAVFMEGLPKVRYFDEQNPEARLRMSLQASFEGSLVHFRSVTEDGRLVLLRVDSDRSPTDFYLFDAEKKSAAHLLSRGEAIDPERTASVQPVRLTARDGRELHGYLTVPNGQQAKNLPLIVNPHGGPFGIADVWGFGTERQLLAARGYAVLQVNFRGSGNYGREHRNAGAREWGKAMQDDLTDATRWAIDQGIADSRRICIYGGSYGGYAALMGAAREPDIYRCAAGYVGVYDMRMMYTRGDIRQHLSGRNYLEEAIGQTDLASISPTHLADRIKAPVFLAAGGADQRAPVDHTEAMEKALKRHGAEVETLIFPNEGHGFYAQPNRLAYYRRLLAFFDRHISAGGGSGSATTTSAD